MPSPFDFASLRKAAAVADADWTPAGEAPTPTAPSPAPNRPAIWPYIAMAAGQGADALTTAIALRNPNLQEGNPLGVGGTMAMKAGTTILATLAMRKLANSGHPTMQKVLGSIVGAEGAIPAAMNIQTMRNN